MGRPVEYVGALITRAGMVLLGRRAAHKSYRGLWDIFGGHVEQDETLVDALVRELIEELTITPHSYILLDVIDVGDRPRSIMLHIFHVTEWCGGEPCMVGDEHDEVRWFSLPEAVGMDGLADVRLRILFDRVAETVCNPVNAE